MRTVLGLLIVNIAMMWFGVLPLMDQRRDAGLRPRKATCPEVCGCANASAKDLVVLIDALRPDVWQNRSLFPSVAKLRDNSRIWERQFIASAPTVTLPRLEAIVSGREGSFLDIVRNFGQSTLNDGAALRCSDLRSQENVLHALSCVRGDAGSTSRNRKIAFYGDDTWLRMFPPTPDAENVFSEYHGVSSFDVHDSVTVDDEVTSRIRRQLSSFAEGTDEGTPNSVDLIWVHYLGYDHIGHVEDPAKSSRATSKLREMDSIVVTSLHQLCQLHQQSSVFVLSDHGMALGGGHGGSSAEERSVFLARLGCNILPDVALNLKAREDGALLEWPQVDVSQHLIRGLSRPTFSAGVASACPSMCVLPTSGGVLSPSFDEAVCGGTAVKWTEFLDEKAQQRAAPTVGEQPSESPMISTTILSIVTLTVLLIETVWFFTSLADAVVFAGSAMVVEFGIKLSSSFIEESLSLTWGLVAGGACLMIALPRVRSGRAQNTTMLLTSCMLLRIAAASLFPSGVKWKTFYASSDVSTWRWMTLCQWLHGAPNSTSSSVLKLLLDAGCSPVVVAAAVLLPQLLLRRAQHRSAALLLASLCTVPTSPLYFGALVLAMAAGFMLVRFARRQLSRVYFLVFVCWTGEVAFGALGRSILVSDVTFSHLAGGTVSSHSWMPMLAGGGLLLWMHAGRIALNTAVIWTVGNDKPLLDEICHGAVLYSTYALCCAWMVAIAMGDHLFYWSVFLPHLLMKCGQMVVDLLFWATTCR
ncbi:phosphodiesterase-like protein, putative [Bodo saltans]|uniref:Phosphodiesterase-like protein, putative n=1 Tax=Bodo saltans TaxID=75058 RepID=A0A0S4J8Y9_BODSA|nr:phosphodiesterase-like protein, putative [Bodo saltans]|eukprot:CUG83930.1 phosphodiesterase-like protein, putative [Bodo saltans]